MAENTIKLYLDKIGESPFQDWFEDLQDKKARAAVLIRIGRVRLGNAGDWKPLEEGVRELRIHYGPGLRIYFAKEADDLVLLLCGGVKRTQDRDIKRAKEYWHDYQIRKKSANF